MLAPVEGGIFESESEPGFTGVKTYSNGAKHYYRDGVHVKNPSPEEKEQIAKGDERKHAMDEPQINSAAFHWKDSGKSEPEPLDAWRYAALHFGGLLRGRDSGSGRYLKASQTTMDGEPAVTVTWP